MLAKSKSNYDTCVIVESNVVWFPKSELGTIYAPEIRTNILTVPL